MSPVLFWFGIGWLVLALLYLAKAISLRPRPTRTRWWQCRRAPVWRNEKCVDKDADAATIARLDADIAREVAEIARNREGNV
jgi:hypothetical protein